MVHTLSPTAHATILAAAAAAAPDEACGLLFGTGHHVRSAVRTANVHPEPRHRFEIDPAALIAAHKAAREGGPALLGYWHSHPGGRPEPSATDRAAASGDGRIWAIAAAGVVRLWIDRPEGFEPRPYGLAYGLDEG